MYTSLDRVSFVIPGWSLRLPGSLVYLWNCGAVVVDVLEILPVFAVDGRSVNSDIAKSCSCDNRYFRIREMINENILEFQKYFLWLQNFQDKKYR